MAVVAFPLEAGEPLLPVLPVQILWVNLVATAAVALPLAFEAMEPASCTARRDRRGRRSSPGS